LGSKTCDHENAAATLGDSEILRIKHPPASHIPALGEGLDDDAKVLASIGIEQAHDVFKHHPLGPYFFDDATDFPEKAGSRPCKPGSCPHAGDILAGEASGEHVNSGQVVCANGSHVGEALGIWESVGEHLLAGGIDFDLPSGFEARLLEAEVKAPDSGE
jgi:hypothetical protein